jgi:hypothetical protein
MDFNATIDLIIKDLDETRKIIDDLKKYPGVPVLQVELAKSKCKSTGEVIALLKDIGEKNLRVKEEQTPLINQQLSPAEKATTSKLIEIVSPAEVENKMISTVGNTSPTVIMMEESTVIQNNVPDSAIIADKFNHLANRYNEQLGSMKSDDDLSDILKTKQVTSLYEAIGVNDRFLFIREIFNGNKDAYNQAISRLDSVETLADAKAIIMSYKGDNTDSKAVNQLIDLVKRKLPSNG